MILVFMVARILFLLDNIESRLIDLLVSHTPDTEIVTDAFSGTI